LWGALSIMPTTKECDDVVTLSIYAAGCEFPYVFTEWQRIFTSELIRQLAG
jgi:hypothetical protein